MPSTSLPLESSATSTAPSSSSPLITITLSPGIALCTSVDFSASSSSSSSALARARFRTVTRSAFSLSLCFRRCSLSFCLYAAYFTGSNCLFARRCLSAALTASRLRERYSRCSPSLFLLHRKTSQTCAPFIIFDGSQVTLMLRVRVGPRSVGNHSLAAALAIQPGRRHVRITHFRTAIDIFVRLTPRSPHRRLTQHLKSV
jgi:hypothetical protein